MIRIRDLHPCLFLNSFLILTLLKMILMVGFVAYGLTSALLLISSANFWLPGSEVGFVLFVTSDMLIDPEQHYDDTVFDFHWTYLGLPDMIDGEQFFESVMVGEHLQRVIGIVATVIVWAMLALMVHNIALWLDQLTHQ